MFPKPFCTEHVVKNSIANAKNKLRLCVTISDAIEIIENANKITKCKIIYCQSMYRQILNASLYSSNRFMCALFYRCGWFELIEFCNFPSLLKFALSYSEWVLYGKTAVNRIVRFNSVHSYIVYTLFNRDNPFGNFHIAQMKCVDEYFSMNTKWNWQQHCAIFDWKLCYVSNRPASEWVVWERKS